VRGNESTATLLGRKLVKLRHIVVVALALIATPGAILAQGFPTRPIRLVAPFPPGSAADTIARLFAPRMGELLKQSIIVDNRPGAGGIVATELVKNASPDGHTLLITSSSHAINASLYARLPYDPLKDFSFVGLSGSSAAVLVVNPTLPAQSAADLIALAKAQPDKLNYASSGSGTTVHLSAVLFATMAGIKATHVPYKGAGASMNDLIAGQVQFMFASIAAASPMIRAGKLRALAVTSTQRHRDLPEVLHSRRPCRATSHLSGLASSVRRVFRNRSSPRSMQR